MVCGGLRLTTLAATTLLSSCILYSTHVDPSSANGMLDGKLSAFLPQLQGSWGSVGLSLDVPQTPHLESDSRTLSVMPVRIGRPQGHPFLACCAPWLHSPPSPPFFEKEDEPDMPNQPSSGHGEEGGFAVSSKPNHHSVTPPAVKPQTVPVVPGFPKIEEDRRFKVMLGHAVGVLIDPCHRPACMSRVKKTPKNRQGVNRG